MAGRTCWTEVREKEEILATGFLVEHVLKNSLGDGQLLREIKEAAVLSGDCGDFKRLMSSPPLSSPPTPLLPPSAIWVIWQTGY